MLLQEQRAIIFSLAPSEFGMGLRTRCALPGTDLAYGLRTRCPLSGTSGARGAIDLRATPGTDLKYATRRMCYWVSGTDIANATTHMILRIRATQSAVLR
eukprot:3530058-Rhodomonas_salina.2